MAEIETARLRLRMFRAADADDYQRLIHGDPDVMRYLPGGVPRSRDRTEASIAAIVEHWDQYGFGLWAVETKNGKEYLGNCGLMTVPNMADTVEVAYALGKPYWGKGIATEAARASLRFGFEHLRLEQIVALAFPPNVASQRVMDKIGMCRAGITDRYYQTDLVLYTLARADFRPGDEAYVLKV